MTEVSNRATLTKPVRYVLVGGFFAETRPSPRDVRVLMLIFEVPPIGGLRLAEPPRPRTQFRGGKNGFKKFTIRWWLSTAREVSRTQSGDMIRLVTDRDCP